MPFDSMHPSYFPTKQPAPSAGSTNLDFHLSTGDYFAFAATVLGFAKETLAQCHCNPNPLLVEEERELVARIHQDLLYLQQNYRIVPKYPEPAIDADI